MNRNYWKYVVIALVGFVVLFHVGVIIYINRGPSYELTSPDYYQQGQNYEQEIQSLNRGTELSWKLAYSTGGLTVTCVNPTLAGLDLTRIERVQIALTRPNKAALDRVLQLAPLKEIGHFGLPVTLISGKWHCRTSFEWQGQVFLHKSTLIVP